MPWLWVAGDASLSIKGPEHARYGKHRDESEGFEDQEAPGLGYDWVPDKKGKVRGGSSPSSPFFSS